MEMLVCGNPEVDVELLRKHTIFSGLVCAAPRRPLALRSWLRGKRLGVFSLPPLP